MTYINTATDHFAHSAQQLPVRRCNMPGYLRTFALAALALSIAPATALAGDTVVHADDQSGKVDDQRVIVLKKPDVRIERSGDDRAERRSVEVRIVGEDVAVRIDGEETPADRVRRDGDSIVIIGEDGEEMMRFGAVLRRDRDKGEFRLELDARPKFDLKFHPHRNGINVLPRMKLDVQPQFRIDSSEFPDWSVRGARIAGQTADLFHQEEPPAVLIGIEMRPPDQALQHHLRLENPASMITAIFEGFPADRAGLQIYDVIVSVDGEEDASPGGVRAALADREPGEEVTLRVIQRGEWRDVRIVLDPYDADRLSNATIKTADASVTPADRPLIWRNFEYAGGPQWEDVHSMFIAPQSRDWEELGKIYTERLDLDRFITDENMQLFVRPFQNMVDRDQLQAQLEMWRNAVVDSDHINERLMQRMQQFQEKIEKLEQQFKEGEFAVSHGIAPERIEQVLRRLEDRLSQIESRLNRLVELRDDSE